MDEKLNLENTEVDMVETEEVVELEESNQDIQLEETIQIVEVESSEETEITIDESIGWVGGDSKRHYSLIGRDDPNQHTITAITGLREELDDIEKLQTVFSDKYNHANYYKWQITPANPTGLFVSFCPSTNYIKVCDDRDDIFGVTVDNAAFIGGQDDVERSNEYGLVVCSGVVSVRCEINVVAGDSVVSNDSGYAQKSESGYGYKVIGVQNIGGIPYAVIPLGISVNQVSAMMAEVDAFNDKVKDIRSLALTANNRANEAYNIAQQADNVSKEALQDALNALIKSEDIENNYKDLEDIVTSTNTIAIQAEAIANNAVREAEAIRSEAEKAANDILDQTSELRKEFVDKAGEFEDQLKNATDDIKEAKDNLDSVTGGLNQLVEDLEPLASWPDVQDIENPTGVAGFVAKANENSTTLAGIVKWKDGEGEGSLAGLQAQVNKNSASVTTLASNVDGVNKSLAGIQQMASDNEASIKMITSFEGEFGKSLSGIISEATEGFATTTQVSEVKKSIASVKTMAEENKASVEAIAGTNGSIAGLQAQVDDNKSAVDILTQTINKQYTLIEEYPIGKDDQIAQLDKTKFYHSDESTYWYYDEGMQQWTSIITFKEFVKKYEVSTDAVYFVGGSYNKYLYYDTTQGWLSSDNPKEAGLSSAIAGIQAVTDEHSASINNLTSWQGSTEDTMARIEQKADANGASINSIVASIDRYSVGEYSQAYGLSREQATSILKIGTIYIPTVEHTETFVGETDSEAFSRDNYYEWDGNDWVEYGDSVVFGASKPPDEYMYWYTESDAVAEGYESYTLYINPNKDGKWRKVNILSGNVTNRIVSGIRQTANDISIEVANARGSAASLTERIGNDEAKINSVVAWKTDENGKEYNLADIQQTANDAGSSIALVVTKKDGDKVINASSIIQAINDDESSVTINANKVNIEAGEIDLTGYVKITDLSGTSTTTINGSNITTGVIKSGNYSYDSGNYASAGTAISLTDGFIRSKNFAVDSNGNAYFNGTLGANAISAVNISASQITSGTIDVGRIGTGSITADKIETGAITANQIAGKTITAAEIATNTITSVEIAANAITTSEIKAGAVTAAKIAAGTITANEIAAGTITANEIATGTITADKIAANAITADKIAANAITAAKINGDGLTATNVNINGGSIQVDGGSFGDVKIDTGGLRMRIETSHNSYPQETYVSYNGLRGKAYSSKTGYSDMAIIQFGNDKVISMPNDDGIWIGGSSNGTNNRLYGSWNIYRTTSGVAVQSDRTKKNNIQAMTNVYDALFDRLVPVTYKYNDGSSDRIHTGFIAQDVEEATISCGLTTKEFAAVCYDINENNEKHNYAVRYDEFVSLNTWQIQKLKSRVAELESKLEALIEGGATV